MPTAVTNDIHVSVHARFEPGQGALEEGRYLFSYRITITNHGRQTVQLLARHWVITDSMAPRTEVDGAGVVGVQPVLAPGEKYTHTSYCELHSTMGRMEGSYQMLDLANNQAFRVAIPAFTLHLPYVAN